MIRHATVLLATLTAAATFLVAPAASASTPAGRYHQQAFAATNQHREHYDRVALHAQDCVQRFAVRQARRMAGQGRMFHQDLRRVLRRCGLSMAGENVAYGYATGRSVVNDGWMHSEGHRENILNPRYRLLGIAARQSADGTWYAAQVFGRNAG